MSETSGEEHGGDQEGRAAERLVKSFWLAADPIQRRAAWTLIEHFQAEGDQDREIFLLQRTAKLLGASSVTGNGETTRPAELDPVTQARIEGLREGFVAGHNSAIDKMEAILPDEFPDIN